MTVCIFQLSDSILYLWNFHNQRFSRFWDHLTPKLRHLSSMKLQCRSVCDVHSCERKTSPLLLTYVITDGWTWPIMRLCTNAKLNVLITSTANFSSALLHTWLAVSCSNTGNFVRWKSMRQCYLCALFQNCSVPKTPCQPGYATVRKWFFRYNFIFRGISKQKTFMESVNFSTSVYMQILNFRDGTLEGSISPKCVVVASPD